MMSTIRAMCLAGLALALTACTSTSPVPASPPAALATTPFDGGLETAHPTNEHPPAEPSAMAVLERSTTPRPTAPDLTLPPAVVSSASPDSSLSARERFDRYWKHIDDVTCVGMLAPQDVYDLGYQSDLVVVGRPVGVQEWTDSPYEGPGRQSLITFRVSQTLRRPDVLFPTPPEEIPVWVDGTPPGTVADMDHLLFLNMLPGYDNVAYLSHGYMSVFGSVEGRVLTPEYRATKDVYGNQLFTTRLDGTSFDELVNKVKHGEGVASTERTLVARRGYFAC